MNQLDGETRISARSGSLRGYKSSGTRAWSSNLAWLSQQLDVCDQSCMHTKRRELVSALTSPEKQATWTLITPPKLLTLTRDYAYDSVAISNFILAIAIAGFKPFGHVREHWNQRLLFLVPESTKQFSSMCEHSR